MYQGSRLKITHYKTKRNMKFQKNWTFIILCIFLGCNACTNSSNNQQLAPISYADAVRLAEAYVVNQGYADKKIKPPYDHIILEESEFATDTAAILTMRYGTLQAKAAGVRQYSGSSWAVGFNYFSPENNIVRCVAIDSLGQNVKMQAQDVRYDWLRGKE